MLSTLSLALADMDTAERAIQKSNKKAKGGDKDAKFELPVLEKILKHVEEGQMIRSLELSKEELSRGKIP